MTLRLAARGIELPAELKDYVRRRAHFRLGRFAEKIRSLSVSLADVNGPRGGIDKRCEVRVDIGLRREVIVRERRAGIHAAIAFALERAQRAVRRRLKWPDTGRRMDPSGALEFGT